MDLWLNVLLNALETLFLERIEDATFLYLLKQTSEKPQSELRLSLSGVLIDHIETKWFFDFFSDVHPKTIFWKFFDHLDVIFVPIFRRNVANFIEKLKFLLGLSLIKWQFWDESIDLLHSCLMLADSWVPDEIYVLVGDVFFDVQELYQLTCLFNELLIVVNKQGFKKFSLAQPFFEPLILENEVILLANFDDMADSFQFALKVRTTNHLQ